jgi:hypothetical protein
MFWSDTGFAAWNTIPGQIVTVSCIPIHHRFYPDRRDYKQLFFVVTMADKDDSHPCHPYSFALRQPRQD